MPRSDFDFSFKFFHPPQRTVPFRNGLLDIRTKHTIAQDRLIIAEQRRIEAERRKSGWNLQSLAFVQKQFEKKIAKFHSSPIANEHTDRSFKMRDRSTSEVIYHHTPWIEPSSIRRSKLSVSLHDTNQNLLSLPKIDDSARRFSVYSDTNTFENHFSSIDMESGDEEEEENLIPKPPKLKCQISTSKRIPMKKRTISKQYTLLPPILTVIPPEDDDILFLTS